MEKMCRYFRQNGIEMMCQVTKDEAEMENQILQEDGQDVWKNRGLDLRKEVLRRLNSTTLVSPTTEIR